nr:MAG: coat protein [Tuatara cloaca-associated tombusvirus-1]
MSKSAWKRNTTRPLLTTSPWSLTHLLYRSNNIPFFSCGSPRTHWVTKGAVCDKDIGSPYINAQNGASKLNTSVLNKMPRDCTARRTWSVYGDVQSFFVVGGSNTHHIQSLIHSLLTTARSTSTMAKTKKQQKQQTKGKRQNVVVRAPTSQSARRTTQNSGETQTILLLDTSLTRDTPLTFEIHPANLPWLKGVAPSYQRWKLNNVKIWYEPRVSTSTNGTVAMAFQKDFQDGIPKTFQSLILSAGSTRSAIWDTCRIQVPPGQAKEYCSLSNFNALSPTDKNDRSLGRLFVWQDSDTDLKGGHVYMSYTPVLSGPIDPTLQ